MKNFYYAAIILSLSVLSCCHDPETIQTADKIFSNGKIYTLDEKKPWAEAVAIKDGKIIFVGDNKSVTQFKGDKTIQQDLKGKMMLPGFIDTHAHPVSGGAYINSLSLDTYANPQLWLKQISAYAKQNPNLKLIFGYGFLASAFGPDGPDRKLLDTIIAERPVFLIDEGFHGAWLNSHALQLLGITHETADPVPGFSYYKRDKNGEPTGYLLESTVDLAMTKLNIINAKTVTRGTEDVIKIMNSYGITSVFDAGALDLESMQLQVLDKLDKQGLLTLHYRGSHMVAESEDSNNAIAQTLQKKSLSSSKPWKIATLKIVDDGTIEGKTAAMFEDYQGDPGNRGKTIFTQQQMNELISEASTKNLDVHVHALGERAVFETLNAIEYARKMHPETNSRFTICHIQVIQDSDIQRFADLDVIAQSTPLWTSYDEFGKAYVSDDQFQRYFRYNSLRKAGVKLTFGSDFPATGAGTLGMSPLYNMEIGHTRQSAGEANAPIQPRKSERLDLEAMIKGYTLDAAYQLNMEHEIGSIETGKLADFVILDKNLFQVDEYAIHEVKVLQTILGGKTIYQREVAK